MKLARTEHCDDRENGMNAICKYIELHRREYGVALFVIPALLCAFAVLGVGYFLAWVLR